MSDRKGRDKKDKDKEKVEIPVSELEDLKARAAERDEYECRWMKVHADYENTRKRLEKEKSDYMRFANEGLVAQLFPIVDNFDMALAAMENATDKEAVMDGIKLVQKAFHRILDDNGVTRIEARGKEFDPNLHEAVVMEDTTCMPDNTVIEEIRPGYLLNDRLLRPAQVKVARNSGKAQDRQNDNRAEQA
jgi:molecular chaperone GrpE